MHIFEGTSVDLELVVRRGVSMFGEYHEPRRSVSSLQLLPRLRWVESNKGKWIPLMFLDHCKSSYPELVFWIGWDELPLNKGDGGGLSAPPMCLV